MTNPPDPLDYRPPDPGPRRDTVPMFVAGLFAGLGLSAVGWSILFRSGHGAAFVLMIAALIGLKFAIGVAVDLRLDRRGFLPGILLSIPLVPLLALGTVAVICGASLRFN